MANRHRQLPRKADARKVLYSGLKPARAMFGSDAASISILETMAILNNDTYKVSVGERASPSDNRRIGLKPMSVLNAITKWVPAKISSEARSFDLLNLDIGEAFPISLGVWLERSVVSIDNEGAILLWVARQFGNQETLSFHDWFDSFWRQDQYLSRLRGELVVVCKSSEADNITLNSMLLLACALNKKNVSFIQTFAYIDGWRMVGIHAKVSDRTAQPCLPSFSDITSAFYAAVSSGTFIGDTSNHFSTTYIGKSSKALPRDIIISDLNNFIGLLSSINLSLLCLDNVWYLIDRTAQEELHRTTNLEDMRVFIDEMKIGQTGYLPRL